VRATSFASSTEWNSPELALVTACCIWPHGPRRLDAIAGATRAPIDWERVLRIAARHRVIALVADGVRRAGLTVPGEIDAELERAAAAAARDGLQFAARAVDLRRAFDAAGLDVLFLKGTPLALLAYGNLGLKAARDIDLLVAPEEEEAAEALLVRLGFVRIEPAADITPAQEALYRRYEKETVWRRGDLVVDLHRRLVNYPSLLRRLPEEPRQEVALPGGATLPTLGRKAAFAYLCAHGALSGWHRLKWLADVGALLSQEDEAGVRELHAAAVAAGAGRCAGQALLLCERLLQLPIPADLLAKLRRDRRLLALEQVALDAIGGRCAEAEVFTQPAVGRRISLSYFRLAPQLRYRVEVARERWQCPEDRARLPLPRPFHFLYPLLRVPFALERLARRRAQA
jgi:hypothetical protein